MSDNNLDGRNVDDCDNLSDSQEYSIVVWDHKVKNEKLKRTNIDEFCKMTTPLPGHALVVEGCPAVVPNEGQPSSESTGQDVKHGEKLNRRNNNKEKVAKAGGNEVGPNEVVAGGSNETKRVVQLQQQSGFNIKTLRYHLESCLRETDGEIDLDSYLNSYTEICKLLDNLGSVIRSVIGRDIKGKIALMQGFRNGRLTSFYETIDKMITYERITNTYKNLEENGSKTILVLHRSLNFVAEFLRNLNTLKADQSVGSMGKEVYSKTLANFHPWGYRGIARLALSVVGKKGSFVSNFHDGTMSNAQLSKEIQRVVNAATNIYTRCQLLYEKNNFLAELLALQ